MSKFSRASISRFLNRTPQQPKRERIRAIDVWMNGQPTRDGDVATVAFVNDTANMFVGTVLPLPGPVRFRYCHIMMSSSDSNVYARLYKLTDSVKDKTKDQDLFESNNLSSWKAVTPKIIGKHNMDGQTYHKVTFDFDYDRVLDPYIDIFMMGLNSSNATTAYYASIADGNDQGDPYQSMDPGTTGLPSTISIGYPSTAARRSSSPVFVMLTSSRGQAAMHV